MLYAVGGWQERTVKTAEQHLLLFNKWKALPSMQRARQSPASCATRDMTLYVFCGADCGKLLNSIEKLQQQQGEN